MILIRYISGKKVTFLNI